MSYGRRCSSGRMATAKPVRAVVERMLAATNGNVTEAAERLGVSPSDDLRTAGADAAGLSSDRPNRSYGPQATARLL